MTSANDHHNNDHHNNDQHPTVIFINEERFELTNPVQTGRALKEMGHIPLTDVLCLKQPGDDGAIADEATVTLKDGDHLYNQPHRIVIFINRERFELANPVQTGRALKEMGHIPLTDVLFLKQPGDDDIVANDATVTLKDGDHLYNQPPADYGHVSLREGLLGGLPGAELLPQPDGWTFVVFNKYQLPDAYTPREVRLLIKLPPLFPEAKPDMFWVTPVVRVTTGQSPKGAGMETVLGQQWQRFSWHLREGAWKPGISDIRDYMRCVRSRFERRD